MPKFDREIGIYIIGGKATPEYKQYVDQHHLTHVHFIEFKTKSELAPYYMAATYSFYLPEKMSGGLSLMRRCLLVFL